MSYNKVSTFPVSLSNAEDFPEWFRYLQNQKKILEIKETKYCRWDLIDRTYVLLTTGTIEIK